MSLHEESARVPLMIDAPGFPSGRVSGLAESIDIYPTLVDLIGEKAPKICQGVSLKPLMDQSQVAVRDNIYTYRGSAHLIRTERWAYIRYDRQGGGEELYDMIEDPGQFQNLAKKTDEPTQARLNQMRLILDKKLLSM